MTLKLKNSKSCSACVYSSSCQVSKLASKTNAEKYKYPLCVCRMAKDIPDIALASCPTGPQ